MHTNLCKWTAFMEETLDGFEIALTDMVLPILDEPQTPPPRIHGYTMETP